MEDQLSLACNDLNCLRSKQEHALVKLQHFCAEESCIFNAQLSAHAWLTCLEKVCEKICSKEYRLVEQSLYELETEEAEVAKTGSIPTEVEIADTSVVESLSLAVHLLPLIDLFFFNSFFFQLPDLLFYDTP